MSDLQVIPKPAKIRFMSYCGDRQGCGTIRIVYPSILLNLYRTDGYAFEADYLTSFVNDPNFYKTYTFVQFQRSATEAHLKIFRHYIEHFRKLAKVPVIYEIDDLLRDIPDWNYASGYYNNNQSPVYDMMRMVDGMTVSTEKLKEVYSEYCKNIVVIPNHLPKFVWGDVQPKHLRYTIRDRASKVRIGWAGSENHFCNPKSKEFKNGVRGGDFGKELIEFIKKTTDIYTWVMSGACPVELDDVKDKIEFHPWVSIFQYPNHVKSLDLDIGMAILKPCLFNQCKSSIKALEYNALGIPGVYTDIDPYSNMTCISNDENGIIEYIEKLAKYTDYRQEIFEKDYAIVKDQLFWEDNNNLRAYVNSYLSLFNKRLED